MAEGGSTNFRFHTCKIAGYDVNIGNIDSFTFTEGIDSPAILGSIYFRDYEGWEEEREIFNGDKLEISFSTAGNEPISFVGYIYGCGDYGRVAIQNFQSVNFDFCSPWFFEAMTRQISKAWKDVYPHEIIQDLIEECGGVVQYLTEPSGTRPTEKLERFVSPNWTAAHIIKYLTDFIMTSPTNHGGFLFFPDMKTDEIIITTINDLLDNKRLTHPAEFIFDVKNLHYEGAIKDFTIESLYDNLRYANQGVLNSKLYGFDYDRNKIIETGMTLSQYSGHTHLSSYAPVWKDLEGSKYQSIKFSHYHPQTRKQTTTDEQLKRMLDGSLRTKYSMLFVDLIKINFMTNGSTTRHTGQLVKVRFPSVEQRKTGISTNKHLEGYYIVRNIKHSLSDRVYTQILTLSTDGFFHTERDDLFPWPILQPRGNNETP